MKIFIKILITIILFITGVWLYQQHQEKQRKKKEEEERLALEREAARKKLYDLYKSNLNHIQSSVAMFYRYLQTSTGYFSNYTKSQWVNLSESIFAFIKQNRFKDIGLSSEEIRIIERFIQYHNNAENLRKKFNKEFIVKELDEYQSFFDDVEGRKLDKQQRTAIITDDDNNLVIAGAGSGKTTTIIGKVSYIINRYNINPDEILLISFTNKSAKTLAERIGIDDVNAMTFHKFGKGIIVDVEKKQPSIFDEAQFRPLLKRYFNDLCGNAEYLTKVTNYFTHFLKPPLSQFDFQNQGDYIQYMKDNNIRSYKTVGINMNGTTTYRMEVVKSIEECRIANFLLFNGIEYKYENPYEHETANLNHRQYKPDFTIFQDGQKVYLEHFGISRNGNVPDWFNGDDYRTATEKYSDEMDWKRTTHDEYGTTLIETYSYEMQEGILFDELTKKLTSVGIKLNPLTPKQIWKIINDAANDEVKSFITLFATFITLLKSNNFSLKDVIDKNESTETSFEKERNIQFIEIIRPIFEKYQQYLEERCEIDFSDMINKAADYIRDNSYSKNFKYVIIDEFQDLSIGRYQLIDAIRTKNPACKLFCVGDDWQSIYRFSGSDIALFKDFERYFGFTMKSKIETTYRFNDPLISLSSDFILKNPNQTDKELKNSTNNGSTTFDIKYSINEEQDDTETLQQIFEELLLEYDDITNKQINILGRYGFDFDRIKNLNNEFSVNRTDEIITYHYEDEEGNKKEVVAQFMTVHKSKGLEADIIIIINCNSGKFGFPSEMSDDHVLDLLLSEADQFENGEERRLFYVAMTRAKERVYFVTDSAYKSKFISEIEVEEGWGYNSKCPICKTADIVLRKKGTARNGNEYEFYGCTNYLYGCNYTETKWIENDTY